MNFIFRYLPVFIVAVWAATGVAIVATIYTILHFVSKFW